MNSSDTERDDELREFIPHHTHDFRNHLNGIEMGLMMLENNVNDPDGRNLIKQIQNEVDFMGLSLNFLSNRLADLEIAPVPAIDLFNRWQSRSRVLAEDSTAWECKLRDEVINVDMQLLADSMCEWIAALYESGPKLVSAGTEEGLIVFEIRQPDRKTADLTLRPGLLTLIEKSGGDFRDLSSNEGGYRAICTFPIV